MLYRCTHCNAIYDIGNVEVIASYADCTVFKSPCCNRTVDERQWKSLPDVTPVYPGEIYTDAKGKVRYDDGKFGRIVRRQV
jgi:hypothetical protein